MMINGPIHVNINILIMLILNLHRPSLNQKDDRLYNLIEEIIEESIWG